MSPRPIYELGAHLTDLANSIPVHVLVGATDPSGVTLPQQALPRGMFGDAASFSTFSCETNPTYISIAPGTEDEGKATGASTSRGGTTPGKHTTVLVTSGQPLNDMFKYIPISKASRLDMAEATLRWRHMAPTAPDTLWIRPFFTSDPFVLQKTPHIYVHGCQPRFATRLIKDNDTRCRIVLVPSFAKTGILVLVGLKSLSVRTIRVAVGSVSTVKS
jgi:DNA polymerase delta subunit 2